MTISEITKDIHENAVAHGWWDEERSFGDIIALCHSELSEALEEYRNKRHNVWFACNPTDYFASCRKMTHCKSKISNLGCVGVDEQCQYKDKKPEGTAVELADCIIRILDYCGKMEIDIEKIIKMKHEYNKTRPYRHGNKAL